MSSLRMLDQEEENNDSIEVTWDDQQRINTFSKLNTRLKLIEDKLESLKQEKEALDDLSTELELADDDQPVLYKIGETFLHMPLQKALARLERDGSSLSSQISELAKSAEGCEVEMKDLKVQLYAKFGRSINLDE